MKLLLENWRKYLNENEENEFGPGMQKVRDYYNSEEVHKYNDLSQSGMTGPEVFDMAYKLSRMETEQTLALIDSLGHSPLTTEVIMRAVSSVLIAEQEDLRKEWIDVHRVRRGQDRESLKTAREMSLVRTRDFMTAWAKKRKEMNDETPT